MEILRRSGCAGGCVENVGRFAIRSGERHYDAVFKGMNDAMATGLHWGGRTRALRRESDPHERWAAGDLVFPGAELFP